MKDLRDRDRKQKNAGGSKKKEKRKEARELERISQLANTRAGLQPKPVSEAHAATASGGCPGSAGASASAGVPGWSVSGALGSPAPSTLSDTPTAHAADTATPSVSTSADSKQEQRRLKLQAWKAVQGGVASGGGGSGGWCAPPLTQVQPATPSVAASPVQRTPHVETPVPPPIPPLPRSHPAKRAATAISSAFGGSSDEDELPVEAAPTKKHRMLWKPPS